MDAVIGVRAFTGGEQERWPSAGLTLGWGERDWNLRPVVGAAGAVDLAYGATETDLSAGLRWQDLGAAGAHPLFGAGYARVHRSVGERSGSANAWFGQAGLVWPRGSGGHLGLNLRVLFGSDLEFGDGTSSEITSVELGFLYGWHGKWKGDR